MKDHRQGSDFLRSIESIAREIVDERSGNAIELTIELIRLIGPGLKLRTGCRCADNGKVHQRLMELLNQHLPLKIVEIDGSAANLIVPTDEIAIAPPKRHR